MTNFSGKPLSPKTGNAACGGPQGGGMDSRRNGVAEISPKYLAEVASNAIPSGYKQTEVGVIPEDWEVELLGSLASIKTGSKNNQDKIIDGLYPFFVRSEKIERLNSYSYDCEAILVPGEGGIGSIFHYINGKFDAHQRVYVIRQFMNCVGKFIYYQMKQRFGKHAMENSVKATVDSLRLPTFQIFPIFMPCLEEQTAIANALSDVDALISELEKLIAKKQAIKTATMQQLLTGRTRLPQFALREDGTPKGTKSSELGEIPENWEVVPLGSLALIKTGSKNNQDKVTDGQFPFFVRSENIERLNSYSYDCEAILVPGEGGIGSIFHYIRGKFDAHQRVYVIRNFEKCVGKYIYFQMRRSFGSHAMENSVKATVDSLRLPTFLEFKVLLPSEEEQTAIATILSDMDAEIQALEQRLGKTRQIKQGMMQELLTGKTRLIQGSEAR